MDNLSSALHNQPLRASYETLDSEERCPIHPKEQHIAVDEETNVFACNKCVFEKRIHKPLFIASYARQTKRRYDDMYSQILKNITMVEDTLTPAQISQKIQLSI